MLTGPGLTAKGPTLGRLVAGEHCLRSVAGSQPPFRVLWLPLDVPGLVRPRGPLAVHDRPGQEVEAHISWRRVTRSPDPMPMATATAMAAGARPPTCPAWAGSSADSAP